MDKRNWKNILLQWISECGFNDRNYMNIEQSDIDNIFEKFRNQHEMISEDVYLDLNAFLKKFYPEFEMHLDDNNCVSSAEYIYVYSLLLHFCCVKYPQTIFHEICQKLPETSQETVVMFFRELVDVQTLNKESLLHAISKINAAATIYISPPSQSNDSFTASSDSMSSTPIKRHLRLSRSTVITPKSHLLEERTRELFNLRAQLDTERYEKGLLEFQIKQNEDQINQLNQEHKTLLQEIQNLKRDMMLNTNFDDNLSPPTESDNEIHQMKKRLVKEVNKKEEEIIYLNDTLKKLQDEKTLVEKKLKLAEQQIHQCMTRMEEIDMKNTHLSEELEKKEDIIKYLEEQRNELEQFVAETRATASITISSTKNRPELNTTDDLLDSSYVQSCNTSRRASESPENLGVSVVDKQLRDKEYECRQLRDDLLELQNNNKLLVEHLKRLTKTECEEFQLDLNDFLMNDENDPTDNKNNLLAYLNEPITQLNKFANCLEKINKIHHFEQNKINQANGENNILTTKLNDLTDNVQKLNDCLKTRELKYDKLYEQKLCLEKSLTQREDELEHMKEEYMKIKKQLEISDKAKLQIQQQIDELKEKNTEVNKKYETLQEHNRKFEICKNEEIAKLEDDLKQKQQIITKSEESEKNLKIQYEQILTQYNKLEKLNHETNDHLLKMKDDLKQKEHELSVLGTQLTVLNTKNADLEKNINTLIEKCNLEKAKYDQQKQNDKTITNLEEELNQWKLSWEKKEKEMLQIKSEVNELEPRLSQLLLTVAEHSNIPNISDHLLDNFELLEKNLKNILKEFTENATKLKEVEMNNTQHIQQIADLNKELSDKNKQLMQQQTNSEDELRKLQAQILQHENFMKDLKEKQLQSIEQIRNDATEKVNSMKKQLEEYEKQINGLNDSLKMEKILCSDKERNLLLVIAENEDLKNTLTAMELELQSSQESHINIINDKQKQLTYLKMQVTKNNEEMDKLRYEALQHTKCITEIEELCKKLKQQQQIIEDMELKNQEIVLKLEEKYDEVDSYKNECSRQKENLNNSNEKLMKLSNDNERITKQVNELRSLLENEQEEKSLLLKSLEKSADQFEMVILEKEQQNKAFECEKLKCQEFSDKYHKLLNELDEQNAQQQRHQNEKLDIYEKAVIEIITVLENQINLNMEELFANDNVASSNSNEIVTNDMIDLFKISSLPEQNCDHILQLKCWLNRLLHHYKILQQQQQLEQANIKELEDHLAAYIAMTDCLKGKVKVMQDMLNEKDEEINANKHKYQQEIDALKSELQKEIDCTKQKLDEHVQKFNKIQKSKVELEKTKTTEEKAYKDKLDTLRKQFEDKQSKIKIIEKELQEFKEKFNKLQNKQNNTQQTYANLLQDHKKLNEKFSQEEIKLETLQTEMNQKKKECLQLQRQRKELEERVSVATTSLDDMLNKKLSVEELYEKQQLEFTQLQKDLGSFNVQYQKQLDENRHLINDIECLKSDKADLKNEIKDLKLDLQRSNENLSELITQIGLIRAEKDNAVEECQTLRKKLNDKQQAAHEFEKKITCLEETVSNLKNELEISKTNANDLTLKNTKLTDINDNITKRLEKMALKLGDTKATCTKLEKENEKMAKNISANAAMVESLQKEKDLLQMEAKTVKDRLIKAERCQEQLALKVRSLEDTNRKLKETNESLQLTSSASKTKLSKLEKMRDTNEDKLRKLSSDLDASESINVKLNLEIGALNSQLKQLNMEQIELKNKLKLNEERLKTLQEQNEILEEELKDVREQKSDLNDQLSKAVLNLDIVNKNYNGLNHELQQLQTEILILREEKTQTEQKWQLLNEKFESNQCQNEQLLQDRQSEINYLKTKLSQEGKELEEKIQELSDTKMSLNIMMAASETVTATKANELKENTALKNELDDLKQRITQFDENLQKEQQNNAKLLEDNKVLYNKYQQSKQRIEELVAASEERIKENRLEWESKLEKMKEKMKILYTEETTKIKTKFDRDLAKSRVEIQELKNQNGKLEEHTRKLSTQIHQLNEKVVDHQKENTLLLTQLKHLKELQETEKFKKPGNSILGPTTSTNLSSNLTMEDEEGEIFNNTYLTDLKTGRMSGYLSRDMCPEELKYRNSLLPPHLKCSYALQYDPESPDDDLKHARHSFDTSMSALLNSTNSDNGCSSSRNDHGGGGLRKKSGGSTHYKRPGPPTPSKNGNRLSLGACISNVSGTSREILKESSSNNRNNGVAITTTKTPTRFNIFSNPFSLSNTRDEQKYQEDQSTLSYKIRNNVCVKTLLQQKYALNSNHKNSELIQTNKIESEREIGESNSEITNKTDKSDVCTSTPRKSKIHFNQRRLLDQLMSSAAVTTSPSPFNKHTPNVKSNKQASRHKATTKLFTYKNWRYNSHINNNSKIKRRLSRHLQKIFTPTSTETTSSATNTNTPNVCQKISLTNISSSDVKNNIPKYLKQFYKRDRDRVHEWEVDKRPSIHLTGNMFAKYLRKSTNHTKIPEAQYKARKHRFEQFNKGRNIDYVKTLTTTTEKIDVNYDSIDLRIHNRLKNNKRELNNTRLICKDNHCHDKSENEQERFEEPIESNYTGSNEFDDSNDIFQNTTWQLQHSNDLISTQDLEEFDYVIAQQKNQKDSVAILEEYTERNRDKFEELACQKLSIAPYPIKTNNSMQLQYDPRNIQYNTNNKVHGYNNGNNKKKLKNVGNSVFLPTAHTTNTSSLYCQKSSTSSRKICGTSLIYGHRLPHINTTFGRRSSSIYIQRKQRQKQQNYQSNRRQYYHTKLNSIIDLDGTLTLLDLAKIWSQMDSSTRLLICFTIGASCTIYVAFFICLFSASS